MNAPNPAARQLENRRQAAMRAMERVRLVREVRAYREEIAGLNEGRKGVLLVASARGAQQVIYCPEKWQKDLLAEVYAEETGQAPSPGAQQDQEPEGLL